MTQSLKTLIENYKDALTQSATLQNWSNAHYGRCCRVYVNIDARNPPGEDDCPYVMLRPTACRYGRGVREKTTQIEMVCCLHDDTFRLDAETRALEYRGVQKCMDMLDLAVTAVAAVNTGNALLQDIEVEIETIEFFPFFMLGCPLTLVEPLTIGATRTSL
jgi:hypothetical protein